MNGKTAAFSLKIVRKVQFFAGFLLILTGFFMPLILNQNRVPVMDLLRLSLREERFMLIHAALLLTVLNIVRALPHYIGAYWVADSLRVYGGGKRLDAANGALIVLLLLLTYYMIDVIHGIHYDFGLPAIMMTSILVMFDQLQYNYVSLVKRTLFVSLSLIALQFLDIMPAAGILPVGRGELSRDIKRAAEVLELEGELNGVALVGFGAFLLFALLIFILLRDENRLREFSELRETNARIRMQAFETEVQNRTLKETQYLVHDLKSPLSVVQTLEGLVRYQSEEGSEVKPETFDRMEKALDQISARVSQLLTLDQRDSFTVDELLHDVMAQISIESYAPYVTAETLIPQAAIFANQGLLSRAVVNLVINAVQAVPEGKEPKITVEAAAEADMIGIIVSDNGRGVSPEQQESIWHHGVSGKGSSGLGLAFVRTAIERFGGHIKIQSETGKGTKISLWIPKEEASDD